MRDRPSLEHRELLRKILLGDADRALEEAGEPVDRAGFTRTLRAIHQPHQIDHQRRCEDRVAALPGELERHRRAEEAPEVDMVPRQIGRAHV